jgi:hypothetical protein
MSDDLITLLRELAAAKHGDLSVAADAADEVERLRADNERLRAEVEHGHRAHKIACEGGDLLRDEIKSLIAQIERLREVIRTIRARCVEMDDSDAVSATLDIASAVLEDTP